MRRIVYSILGFCLLLCFSGCALFHSIEDIGKIHRMTDIKSYGNYPTMKYGYEIEAYTEKVMPKKIENFFFEPIYYLGYCNEPFMCEMYLEFKIENESQYENYITELTQEKSTQKFFYDEAFKECVITDVLMLQHLGESNGPTISKTEIQKILFSNESNTIIFISLIVLNQDMPFPIEDFYYFEKFNIIVEDYYNGERLWQPKVNELTFLY